MGKPPQGDEAFDSLIRRAWEAGRREWPEVDLPTEIFSRHFAGLLTQAPEDVPLADRIEQLDLKGLYLACACVSGVSGASELFEHHYMARLPALLGYLKLSHHDAGRGLPATPDASAVEHARGAAPACLVHRAGSPAELDEGHRRAHGDPAGRLGSGGQ